MAPLIFHFFPQGATCSDDSLANQLGCSGSLDDCLNERHIKATKVGTEQLKDIPGFADIPDLEKFSVGMGLQCANGNFPADATNSKPYPAQMILCVKEDANISSTKIVKGEWDKLVLAGLQKVDSKIQCEDPPKKVVIV